MTKFKLHTIESAPEGSKELLEGALKQNGFIPNLYKIMAESPEVLKAYTQKTFYRNWIVTNNLMNINRKK